MRDDNGCLYSTTIVITAGTGPTNVGVNSTPASCGADNGTITIGTVTGGSAPYVYSVNNGPFSGDKTYTGLTSGSHTIDVRDDNGCIYSTTEIIASGTGPSDINVSSTNESCGRGNGSITITSVTGGTAPYTYSVDGSNFTSNRDYDDLNAGSHSVQVMDANGCLYFINVNITNSGGPTSVDVTPTDAECGVDNGSFTIDDVNGGRAPYAYSIDGSGFTSQTSYTDLAAGSHTIEIRDDNGCVFTSAVNISSAGGPTDINTSSTPAACGTDNGRINITGVTGGTDPYTYSIDGGNYGGSTSFNNLPAGQHTIDVRDANGCIYSTIVNVGQGNGPTAIDINPTNASCGANNGRITIADVTGGSAPYTYSVDNGPFTGATSYTNISAGTHVVEVRDENGCSFTTLVTITSGSGPTDIDANVTDAACGADNGSIRITDVTGGNAPYEYSIDNGSYSGNTNYTGLSVGPHTIDVRDENGCIYSTTLIIGSGGGPTDIDVSTTPAACGADNGSIRITDVTGGSGPYQYSIDGGNYSSTTNYPNLGAGAHTVAVRDDNGCVYSTTINITSSGGPTDIDVSTTPAACGADNGSIRITDVTGGSGPYQYSIDGGNYSSTTNYPNLGAGAHTVAVRDDNGCVYSTTINITSSGGPTDIDVSTTPAACGADNGSIRITDVTGGSGPYQYSIDGGNYSSTTNYPNLGAGAHTVAVRDDNGCVYSTTINITSSGGPTDVNVTTTPAACGADNGSIRVTDVTGGSGPYQYSIDGGNYTSTTNYSDLGAGAHTVAVRDDNGCVYSTTINITSSGGPTDVNVTTTPAACGADNGSITIGTVTGGDAPYEYSVDGGAYGSPRTYDDLGAGAHTVAVRDDNGCVYSTTINITSSGGPTDIDVTTTPAACGADNG